MKNQPAILNGERVLTTKALANFMEVSISVVSSIATGGYKQNRIFQDKKFDSLIEGTDYFDLKGEDRLSFVDNNRGAFLDISGRGGNFRIFTRQGTVKMARNLRRIKLYYEKIYDYFSLQDLTEYYLKYRNYFIKSTKKESARLYKESNQSRLDQIETSLNNLTLKVEEQRQETSKRIMALEERIDKLLFQRIKESQMTK